MEHELESKRLIWTKRLGLLGFLMCMVGLPLSPALLSIGSVVVIFAGLVSYAPRVQLKRFYQDKFTFFLSLIFIVQLLSFFWTEDKEQFLEHLRIKAPFFFGLYGLAVLGPFDKKWLKIGLVLFVLAASVTGTLTVIDYFLHKEQYDLEIQVSKPLPIFFDINHIYFSLLLAFSVFGGIWLFRQKNYFLHKFEKYLWLTLAVAHIGYLHILTARTGLLAFYVAVFVLVMFYIFQKKKYLLGALILAGFFAAPVLGYKYVPSLQYRVDNTKMDLDKYFSGDDPNYLSLGMRFESWKAAWGLFKSHPITGVSMADLHLEMWDQYLRDESMLCDNNYMLPHNEFIQIGAGLGLLGLLSFSLGWFFPLFKHPGKHGWLFWAFWVILSFGMMGESVVERQIGLMFVVMMWTTTRWLAQDVQELGRSEG